MPAHGVNVWLVNTGWSGGPYGVGQRLAIGHTRALVHAALDGSLSQAPMITEPLFGLAVPTQCPGVPAEILTPRNTWKDKAAYDTQAKKLAGMFADQLQNLCGPGKLKRCARQGRNRGKVWPMDLEPEYLLYRSPDNGRKFIIKNSDW